MSTRAPVETKVIAGALGAGGSSAVGTFVLWLLGVTVWHAPSSADKVEAALAAVPTPVSVLVLLVISTGVTALAAYFAPHTARPPVQDQPPILRGPAAALLQTHYVQPSGTVTTTGGGMVPVRSAPPADNSAPSAPPDTEPSPPTTGADDNS